MAGRCPACNGRGQIEHQRERRGLLGKLRGPETVTTKCSACNGSGTVQEKRVLGRDELLQKIGALSDSTTRRGALSDLKGQSERVVLEVIKSGFLSSADHRERYSGISALESVGREFGWTGTVSLLELSLDDTAAFVVDRAVRGLNWVSYNENLKPLVAACALRRWSRFVDILVGTPSADNLGSVEELLLMAGPDCVPSLLRALPTLKDKYQIQAATRVLEKYRQSPTQSKAAILESLRSHDVGRRKKACYESVHVADKEVVDALVAVLKNFPEPQYNAKEDVYQSTRKGAAYALAKIAHPCAVPILREALNDDEPWGVRKDGTLVRGVTGMRAFGTSVADGLKEADTDFARSLLTKA